MVKRLLEYADQEMYVTTSVACRNALFPTVAKDQRGENNNKFPAWAAEKFFKDVSRHYIFKYIIEDGLNVPFFLLLKIFELLVPKTY